jgi:hypothetical protein
MSYLGDTLTVGLILVLLFGSIALYLYTRVQQTEQKVGLLESIVLDLKLTGEIQSFTDPHESLMSIAPVPPVLPVPVTPVSSVPVASVASVAPGPVASSDYTPFLDVDEDEENKDMVQPMTEVDHLPLEDVPVQEEVAFHPVSSYDGLSLKELQALVRSRGLVVEKGAKKQTLLDLLKHQDAMEESGAKSGLTSSSALLESPSAESNE